MIINLRKKYNTVPNEKSQTKTAFNIMQISIWKFHFLKKLSFHGSRITEGRIIGTLLIAHESCFA